MRVLVTGGAGFTGSHLTDALVTRGDEVTVVDDMSRGQILRVKDLAKIYQVDITDPCFRKIVEQGEPELICHLAAQIDVRSSVMYPTRDASINLLGTVNVLEAARIVNARVLFASSGGALCGKDAPIPAREHVLPQPSSPYGLAKYCAEQYIGLYNRLHSTQHSIMRLANVYGPGQDPSGEAGVVSIFCNAILADHNLTIYGDGKQTRDYVYVRDVVRAFIAAANVGRPGIWNVGTGSESAVLDLVRIITEIADRPVKPVFKAARPGEVERSVLAVDKAARELSWRASTQLSDGIRQVYGWIQRGADTRICC